MFDPKLLDGVQTVHFIGCGGSGTYPLIQILHSQGYAITGSDVEETKNTEAERALGVRVFIGHDAIKIPSSGFARFKSWISFVLAYTSSFGSSKSVISMISDNFAVSFIKNGSDILAAGCTSWIA